MNKKQFFSNGLLSLGLLLTVTTTATATPEMNDSHSRTQQFRRIDQPLSFKVGITLGGLALIGAELWWFMGKKAKIQQAQMGQGLQELTVTVEGGYQPDYLVVQRGTPVRLNFLRKDPNSCLEDLLIPDLGIDTHLPLNEIKTVEFTPEKPGEYQFTCGMRMFRGVLKVAENSQTEIEASSHYPPKTFNNHHNLMTASNGQHKS